MVKKLLYWLDKVFTPSNAEHKVKKQRDPAEISYDVLLDIFPFLTRKQLCNAQLVNRHFSDTIDSSINTLHFIASMINDVRCRVDQPRNKHDGLLFKSVSNRELFLPLDGFVSMESLPQYVRLKTVELSCWLLDDRYMVILSSMRHCFNQSHFVLRYRPAVDSLKLVEKFFEEMLTPIFGNCSTYNIYEAPKYNDFKASSIAAYDDLKMKEKIYGFMPLSKTELFNRRKERGQILYKPERSPSPESTKRSGRPSTSEGEGPAVARYAKVVLMEKDIIVDSYMGTTFSDFTGHFVVSGWSYEMILAGGLDPYLKIEHNCGGKEGQIQKIDIDCCPIWLPLHEFQRSLGKITLGECIFTHRCAYTVYPSYTVHSLYTVNSGYTVNPGYTANSLYTVKPCYTAYSLYTVYPSYTVHSLYTVNSGYTVNPGYTANSLYTVKPATQPTLCIQSTLATQSTHYIQSALATQSTFYALYVLDRGQAF
uniref:F-box domain-containing protein n=1 Tax=Ditylenchus dipsaci TaxID=166011 RepID=A0A915DMC0_9BILA